MVSYFARLLLKAKSYPLRTAGILFLCGMAILITIIHHRANAVIAHPGGQSGDKNDGSDTNQMQGSKGKNKSAPSGGGSQTPQVNNQKTGTGVKVNVKTTVPTTTTPKPKPTTPKPTPKPHPKSQPYLSNLKPILVIIGEEPVPNRNVLLDFLKQMRLRHDVRVDTAINVDFADYVKDDYGAVVFERLGVYTKMLNGNVTAIHQYCKNRNIGIVTFASVHDNEIYGEKLKLSIFPLHVHRDTTLQDYQLYGKSPMLRITKNGGSITGHLRGKWAVFVRDHATYLPVSFAKTQTNYYLDRTEPITYETVMQDTGKLDGIKRVIFGQGLEFWMHRLLFLDALSFVSAGNIMLPLDRFVSVDIDDVFMDYNGRKMKEDDVEALIKFQDDIATFVPGFKLNMGYMGAMFETGTAEEQRANAKLVAKQDRFWWFDNTYDRLNIRDVPAGRIAENIGKNLEFAEGKRIDVTHYAVPPDLFGVYPLYDPLYDAWGQVKVTSTSSAHVGRGFMYKGIKVLPRSSFKMFNKDIFLANAQEIFRSAEGGDTFNDILCNPINIFMSYFCNYGMDRVALYAIARAFNFVRKWTNLRLFSESSAELADRYFTLFPNDKEPLWTDPCRDKMYMSDNSLCNHRPRVIIIGPSITGSETLRSLLLKDEDFGCNKEENNFFSNDDLYSSGPAKYLNQFPAESDSLPNIFEYSTEYFSYVKAAERIRSLVPEAQIIILLSRPELAAKECYDNSNAKLAFSEAVKINSPHPCIERGLYADHLRRWLTQFPKTQMLVIDTDSLYFNTIDTMRRVQTFLHVRDGLDYSEMLSFNETTKKYCSSSGCLGDEEIPYRTMETMERSQLLKLYSKQNSLLSGLLRGMKQVVPQWADKP